MSLTVVDGRVDLFLRSGLFLAVATGLCATDGRIALKRGEDLGRSQNVARAYAELSTTPLRLVGGLFTSLIASAARGFGRVRLRMLFLVLLGFVHVVYYRVSFRFSRIFQMCDRWEKYGRDNEPWACQSAHGKSKLARWSIGGLM